MFSLIEALTNQIEAELESGSMKYLGSGFLVYVGRDKVMLEFVHDYNHVLEKNKKIFELLKAGDIRTCILMVKENYES